MLTDRQFPDALPPATNPHSDLAHPMPLILTAADRPYIFALSVTDNARRYVKLLDADAADEFLVILGDMLIQLNPAPAPVRVPAAPAGDDAESVFPGIFAGHKAGDFGGLPPAQATVRVPELAIRLSGIAGGIDAALALDADKFAWLAQDALETASRKLHAIADELAAEGGDQ